MVIKIWQKTDYFARQQRVKLFNTQIIKKSNNEIFSKIDENFDKKN